MSPDNIQHQQGPSFSLPPVPTGSSAPMTANPDPNGQNQNSIQPTAEANSHYAVRAEQLAVQYGSDPYKLSAALAQLKTAFLAEQYHITSNQAGN